MSGQSTGDHVAHISVSEEEPTWEEEPDLPEQNTQRVSGRVRKRSKLLDGYEI